MNRSIILKTLLILGSLIIIIFIGFGYLFSQNDKELIEDIRKYNLESAMKELDKSQSDRLKLNQIQMKDIVNSIAKNSSEFLMNYDSEGLKKSLVFDMKKDSVKAIEVWDNEVNEVFLLAEKKDSEVLFTSKLGDDFKKFTKLNKILTSQAMEMLKI